MSDTPKETLLRKADRRIAEEQRAAAAKVRAKLGPSPHERATGMDPFAPDAPPLPPIAPAQQL